MRLTGEGRSETDGGRSSSRVARPLIVAVIILLLFAIAWLDYVTGTAPVEHLYYLPIILAAVTFDYTGGLTSAFAAIGFYHLANGHLRALRYGKSDFLQIALFLIVGIVTARLAGDRRVMTRLAHTDDLTGLHNLRSFESQLKKTIENEKVRKTATSMLVMDVDQLKLINENYGHLAGAEAVREVGQVISRCLDRDTIACRYGGDEFAVVIPADECAALDAAERLRKAVENDTPFLVGRPFPAGTITVSIGVAIHVPGNNRDSTLVGEELFRAADRALYLAKQDGRNRVRLSSEIG
jgi:diguanylate cyclase (GGDEF)-like protein